MEWSLVFAGILATWASQASPILTAPARFPLLEARSEQEAPEASAAPLIITGQFSQPGFVDESSPEKKTWWQRHGPHGEHPILHKIAGKVRDCWDSIHPHVYGCARPDYDHYGPVYMTSGEGGHVTAVLPAGGLAYQLAPVPPSNVLRDSSREVSGGFWGKVWHDENRRVLKIPNTEEDLRQIEDEWSRFWFGGNEQFWDAHCPFNIPYRTHLTYDRISGSLE